MILDTLAFDEEAVFVPATSGDGFNSPDNNRLDDKNSQSFTATAEPDHTDIAPQLPFSLLDMQ